ncbi:RNA polymerase subunit sigma-70 [Pedobacter yulinensis]|uniref:RNA polymerase subunit sigma-70 n=1 Tax=Pedobacter yulinensis TaxID=2126353 RepID=A0A2T3HJW4_9SPHI|nr:RNA polymerase sigma-70 factor [Pedobacter yulinensis]PST82710.1 RNA polymerase subunit sigma-70 [Pedobacter yulinensis]
MKIYRSCTDSELINLIKGYDQAAYKELYQRYWYLLYKHARKMLHNEEEAKDVVQDVFTTLWSRVPAIEINTDVAGYLYAATRNKILNLFDRGRVQQVHLSTLPHPISAAESKTDYLLRERELAALIEQEIARLPQKMRCVFELSRKDNLSHKEIAAQLDISDKTVKKQIVKAIKVLRLRLGPLYHLFSFL